MVKLRLFTIIRRIVGSEYIDIEITSLITVYQLLCVLVDRYPEIKEFLPRKDDPGSLIDYYYVMVKGNSIGLETKINNNDVLTILPPVAGG